MDLSSKEKALHFKWLIMQGNTPLTLVDLPEFEALDDPWINER